MILSNLILMSIVAILSIQAQELRAGQSCGLLSGKVYCFFGSVYVNSTFNKNDNSIKALDLTNATGKSASELESHWTTVTSNTNGVDISPRVGPQAIEMGDSRRMFFYGGYNSATTRLADPTIIYDAVDNIWTSHNPYTEPPYGPRQIYYGSAVNVPNKGIALYGGYEEFINTSWTTYSQDVASFNFAENISRVIGFTQVAYFDMSNATKAWSVPVPLSSWTSQFIAFQASVYDPVNRRILYIGGIFRRNERDAYGMTEYRFPLSKAWTFDTVTNTWLTVALGGTLPDDGRTAHTLTLAPSTNRDVIMYGGNTGGIVADDYCFILNLESNEWRRVNVMAPPGTALARAEHSAVLTRNDSLLIMWGVDRNQRYLNSILMLDISDINQIRLSSQYLIPNSSDTYENASGSRLSGGAIGGIAAACAGTVLCATLLFCFIKKRRSNKKQVLSSQSSRQHQESQDVNLMEVDWEKIEENYTELPQQPIPFYHPSNGASSPGQTTIMSPPHEHGNRKDNAGSLYHDSARVTAMNPHSVDDDISLHGGERRGPAILKPDVSEPM